MIIHNFLDPLSSKFGMRSNRNMSYLPSEAWRISEQLTDIQSKREENQQRL